METSGKIIIAIIIVLLLIGLAVGIYFLVKHLQTSPIEGRWQSADNTIRIEITKLKFYKLSKRKTYEILEMIIYENQDGNEVPVNRSVYVIKETKSDGSLVVTRADNNGETSLSVNNDDVLTITTSSTSMLYNRIQ